MHANTLTQRRALKRGQGRRVYSSYSLSSAASLNASQLQPGLGVFARGAQRVNQGYGLCHMPLHECEDVCVCEREGVCVCVSVCKL